MAKKLKCPSCNSNINRLYVTLWPARIIPCTSCKTMCDIKTNNSAQYLLLHLLSIGIIVFGGILNSLQLGTSVLDMVSIIASGTLLFIYNRYTNVYLTTNEDALTKRKTHIFIEIFILSIIFFLAIILTLGIIFNISWLGNLFIIITGTMFALIPIAFFIFILLRTEMIIKSLKSGKGYPKFSFFENSAEPSIFELNIVKLVSFICGILWLVLIISLLTGGGRFMELV